MLYYRFRNYEEFKEIFAVEKRSNGAEVRKNKILLSHLKNAALLNCSSLSPMPYAVPASEMIRFPTRWS